MSFDVAALAVLVNVILIDAILAVDNALVMGAAAAKLPVALRKRALVLGVGAAAIMRAGFAIFAIELLKVPGLQVFGGLMLLWVAWKLYKDAKASSRAKHDHARGKKARAIESVSVRGAVLQILVADLSMSFDNVLAVAGAAREHIAVMVVGLICSVFFMGIAANFLAKTIQRHGWLVYLAVAIIVYIALAMLYEGVRQASALLSA